MGEDAEEIIVPTETQGLTAFRRLGLMVFLAVTFLLLGASVVAFFVR